MICDKIKLLEKIFVFRAIYVPAQHGPYEKSNGDPSGNSKSNCIVCIFMFEMVDPTQVIIRPDIVEITGPRVVTEGGHVR